MLWIDDLLVVYQLKDRTILGATSEEAEERWHTRKVVAKGSRQIRDTLTYLADHKTIALSNHRGDQFDLTLDSVRTLQKVIVYRPNNALPLRVVMQKHHRSQSAGVIHLLQAKDYLGIVETLLTPAEFAEYLEFREELIERWPEHVNRVPEPALVGQYLCGDVDSPPDLSFYEYLTSLDHRAEEWDISGIIKAFPMRMTGVGNTTDYYQIVRELAKLKRNELREFKKRFQLAMERCGKKQFTVPYRIFVPRTGCGFLFIPLEAAMVAERTQGLQNLTIGCKYDFKADKCIGISFYPDDDQWYSVEWCLLEQPWSYDPDLDAKLAESFPFRKTKTADLGRYTYDEE